ncbi:hypothetical protein [Mycobacteroides franklinii]|uniref:hypothetical protein n=1 Tax=Mycobacteroides franklinii TaxID=948102 RepID=UPI0013E8B0F8|nr:hypothetical protein [Mycobacteroides franklinii]
MTDTWESRDLPVLKAAVELWEEHGRPPRATAVAAKTSFDGDTVQRALRALDTEPYFEKSMSGSGQIIAVGKPTSAALRVAGQWPSPETQIERVIAALEAAADDDSRQPEERSRLRQVALSLRGAAFQIAIGALGGAGGNLLTG